MRIQTIPQLTDFEWELIKHNYENIATQTFAITTALDTSEIGAFTTEQLDYVYTLFSAVESHAYQITALINRELDRRS